MTLNFTGHSVNPVPVVHVDHVQAEDGDRQGAFFPNENLSTNHEPFSEIITSVDISFSPQIQISNGLDPATEQRVLRHEQAHATQFREIANRLRQRLQQLIQQDRDLQLDSRWEWFLWDIRTRANQYHQQTGEGAVLPLLEPFSPRPL